jgi:hypothetical protein
VDKSPVISGEADDSAKILADCRALYLKELGQLLREAEPVSDLALKVFVQAIADYFDEMVSTARRGSFGDASGLTASCISLVHENDLELEIRLGEFSAKLLEKTGGDLWRVYLRFVTLLKRPDLPTSDNPVGPKGMATGLLRMCGELGEGHEQTLARVERLQTYFAENLPVLYANLNALFENRHVEAAQPSIISAPDVLSGTKSSVASLVNPAAALQQNLMAQMPGGGFMPSGGGGGGGGGTGGASANLFSQAMFDRLLSRLDELERLGRLPAGMVLPDGAPSLENLIPGLFNAAAPAGEMAWRPIKSAELGIPNAAPEAAAIDTLALIFEAIFDMPALPEAIKSALSSLQIPMLKAAMLDPAFFTNEAHPARQLFDRMARAVLGLPPDVTSKHPVCLQVLSIAAHVRSEFTNDLAVFERYVGKLDALIAERDQEIAQSVSDWLPLLTRMDQRGLAETRCQEAIEAFCVRGAPQGIANFLRQHWYKVLLQVWVEHGEESAAWQEHNAVIDSLLWSVQAKTEAEDRKRLSRMLPVMLQLLSKGMERIKVSEEVRTDFLDTCFSLQTAALRGVTQAPAENAASLGAPALDPELFAAPVSALPEAGELHSGALHLKTIDIPGESPLLSRLRPLPVKTGEWLEFQTLDAQSLIGRLSYISPENGKLLFCNPEWGFALAMHPGVMEKQLREKQALRCSANSLFNTAAEKALNRSPAV